MTIKRYGIDGGTGTGGQHLPFSRAVEAGGWLYISGQTPMKDGEVVEGDYRSVSPGDPKLPGYYGGSGIWPGRRGAR